MVEFLIANIFGPFILFGIFIAAFGIMTGAKVEGLLQAYGRFCFHLCSALAIPAFRGLSYLAVWFGDKVVYVLDNHHESAQINDFVAGGSSSEGQGRSSDPEPSQNTKTADSSGDTVDVEIIS